MSLGLDLEDKFFALTFTLTSRINVMIAGVRLTLSLHPRAPAGLGFGDGLRRLWWSGVVVSALALINEVNQHRARLVLRWATVSGFNSRCRTFISVYNQPATQGQLSRPSLRGR